MIVAVLVLWVGGFAYMFKDAFWANQEVSRLQSAVELEKKRASKIAKRLELQIKLRAANAVGLEENSKSESVQTAGVSGSADSLKKGTVEGIEIMSGWVTVIDKWGHQAAKIRASVTGNGWLALPSRFCYGGWKWYYSPDTGGEYEMLMGRWSTGDIVGLWQVYNKDNSSVKGPPLNRWKEKEPVSWYSIETLKELHEISLSAVRSRSEADLVEVILPDSIVEAGLFMQNGQVVGWSFGDWLFNGYLWTGKSGDIYHNTQISDFYRVTFAEGREEKFAEALSLLEKSSATDIVTLLVDALLTPAKLAEDDTPYYLQSSRALKLLKGSVSEVVRSGQGANIFAILSNSVLLELGDIDLLLAIIPVVTLNHGFAAAVEMIEGTGSAIVEQGKVDVPALNEQHMVLYQEWLQSLVTAQAMSDAWQVLNNGRAFYPEDPYLYLLGVELELLNGDWQKAEQLLYDREFSAAFQDRFQLLARRISELKSDEGKIVIRFTSDSSKISVNSNLNDVIAQEFLVDTGASMVTIPAATAEALSLEIVPGYHGAQRIVSTAGGMVSAEEVVINSLEIGGWIEYNVKALVLDIPGQPGVGLLGLNYLGRFQMDLRNDEGLLLLSPR